MSQDYDKIIGQTHENKIYNFITFLVYFFSFKIQARTLELDKNWFKRSRLNQFLKNEISCVCLNKIIKENIEEIILPLAEKLLDIHPEKLEEVGDELQRTLERKPDFLKKVVHKDSKKDYILHIEFQVVNDKEMRYRMHEYYALLHRKYKINVLQVVFYIGDKKCTMTTKLDLLNLSFSYNLYSLKDISYKKFIDSDKPEEVILAILADFENEKSEKIIEAIFNRIEATTKQNLEREKVVKQLEILSTLRKLQSQIVNQLQCMPFIYNIKNDFL
jgi:hypothetical protein